MLRDPQARYFNDEEYEPDPDQLPLAKTMRRFGFVIFICGTVEVSDVDVLVFGTHFEARFVSFRLSHKNYNIYTNLFLHIYVNLQLVVGLLVYSYFENFKQMGFVGGPGAILVGCIAMCTYYSK